VPRTQPGQEIAFKDVLGLVLPDRDSFLGQLDDDEKTVVGQVLAGLDQTRIYILDGAVDGQMAAIQQAFSARRQAFEATSPTGDPDTAFAVHHGKLAFSLGAPDPNTDLVDFEMTGESRQVDETLPDPVRQVGTSLALGLMANPDTLHLPAWCGFKVLYQHPLTGGDDTVNASFGQLTDDIGIDDDSATATLPRIDLVLSGGFPGLHQVGQLFHPNIHARSLSYDVGTNQFDRGGSKLSGAVTPFGIPALAVNIGMQRTIVDAMNAASDEVRQGLLQNLLQSPTIERLMTTVSSTLLQHQ
jgi:hypothetical protein